MKKIIKYLFGLLFLTLVVSTGCKKDQIVEDPITPGGFGYSLATFTTDFTGNTVTEGDTITYIIKLNKMLDRALTFTLAQSDGTADVDNDFIWEPVTMAPYTDSTSFQIIVNYDVLPEVAETAKFELGVFGLADRYLLDPATVNPVLDLTINNYNDPGGLTVAMYWADDHDDWDAYVIDEAGAGDPNGWGYDYVGYEMATGADPEIGIFMEDYYGNWIAPDGTYYVDVDPWDVSNEVTDFVISIGHPDGSVEFFDVTFDMTKADAGDYPTIWGYSVLKIVKTGLSYVVTELPEYTAAKVSVTKSTDFSPIIKSGKKPQRLHF